MRLAMRYVCLALLWALAIMNPLYAQNPSERSEVKKVTVGDGVELHYIEHGAGVPVVFVHGGLEDCTMWKDQVRVFGDTYHAIAYSRRYNFPNSNQLRPNHSAAVDAEDLAELIQKLNLGKSHIVGFSYGGSSALFLAVKHPELVRTLTLAEPALIPWLDNLSAPRTAEGKAVLADYTTRLIEPAGEACKKGDDEAALRIGVDYLIRKGMYDDAPPELRQAWLRNVREWRAIFTSPNGLAAPEQERVRALRVPTLLLSGGKSAASCRLADAELKAILPQGLCERAVFQDSTHAMWIENPEGCREAVLKFLKGK
ncbi:MAG: alpha/beta hydrolase [Bryobacteraceae bacterium]|nr:alpha/beta hydrolase [Bryobacteraceae bacterium]